MTDKFAFIIHPIDLKRDIGRKFPTLGKLPAWLIEYLSVFAPPVHVSNISGIQSKEDGRLIQGLFIACTLSPAQIMNLPTQIVYKKIIQAGRYAEKLGANLLGLGAFTSVVGDSGVTIANNLSIPVTTGDSYTIATAVQAIEKAANMMELPINTATIAIVGATGAIGSICAEMLAPQADKLILIGRRIGKLEEVAQKARTAGCAKVDVTSDITQLTKAHLVITVTSAIDTVIKPQHLRRGAIVCDVARPRDVSQQVAKQRPDVLVIEGGMVEIPGPVDFGFNFGFPPKMAYACMAETMALTLEKRFESFTLGKDITLSQVKTIDTIATKHGFKLGGFRSFERAVTDEEIAQIRLNIQSGAVQPKQQTTNINQTVIVDPVIL